jgi:hypothetical protein
LPFLEPFVRFGLCRHPLSINENLEYALTIYRSEDKIAVAASTDNTKSRGKHMKTMVSWKN